MRLVVLERSDGLKVTINADNILFMQPAPNGDDKTYIKFIDQQLTVKGEVDEVRRKIVNTSPV